MKNYVQEVCQTSDSQPYHLQHLPQPSLYFFDNNVTSFNSNSQENPIYETFCSRNYNIKVDQQFMRKTNRNILISTKSGSGLPDFDEFFQHRQKEKSRTEKKIKSKPIQKESRNVHSNVLRIFFKCVLQLGSYEALIKRTIEKLNLRTTSQSFYLWLLQFNINFKNYIRSTQIKRLLSAPASSQQKIILMVLLRHYLNNHAVSHCLTSKRIESSSLKMHLSGLKELYQDITKMKQQSL